MRLQTLLRYAIVLAFAGLLGGCTGAPTPKLTVTDNGVAGLPAEEILARATAAMTAAGSYRIHGVTATDAGPVTVDMQVSGTRNKGSVTVAGTTIEFVRSGTDVYIKAPAAVWAGLMPPERAELPAQLAGKYAKLDAADARFSDLTNLSDPTAMLTADGVVTKGDVRTVNGFPAIALIDSSDGSRLYVATVGPPRPVRIETGAADGVDFTGYGVPVAIATPPAGEVVDLTAIIGD
jgi:hypothetical protein